MHPGFIPYWKNVRCGDSGFTVGWGIGVQTPPREREENCSPDDSEAGPIVIGGVIFGTRRPLRFLTYKLGLSEPQVEQLARILDELKTERAQADVDQRRTVSAFADAVEAETFDEKKALSGGAIRMESAAKMRGAALSALERLHRMLDVQQRARLAHLIRTGAFTV